MASQHSLPGELVMYCLSVTRGITMADSPAHIARGCRLQAAGEQTGLEAGLKESQEEAGNL